MQVVLGVLLLIVMCVAIYFHYEFEEANEYILELEERLDREKYGREVLEKKICEVVFEEPHLGSVKNLQNKVETILENAKYTNIA